MKKIFYLAALVIFITSCKEQKPPGLDLGGSNVSVDSSYVAPVETKQAKIIIIEELTGVKCSNCPEAATIIKTISDANPGRILTAGLHPPSSGFTEPILGKSKHDFRQAKVDEIITLLGVIEPLPSASLNREKTNGNKYFDQSRGAWISRITPWLSQTTPVNIHLESTYSADNNTGALTVKVALTEDLTDDIYLTVYITENDIEDYQDVSGVKMLYTHEHVFRDCITSVSGSSLNFANKNAGTVLQKRIAFSPIITGDNAWNLDNCKIIAFVHKSGADQAVLHAQEIKLK